MPHFSPSYCYMPVEVSRLTGYNTDGEGSIRSLEKEAKLAVPGKRIFTSAI